ncbi:MAG: ammonium transporter [Phycisphaeraceae bacterium]|nr:ammonium transporter [Phycisphaeraceae bacterium]
MEKDGEIEVEILSWATFVVDNLWILIAAALVFLMHLGFATLEAGLTRSKETVNILFKNTMIPCIGLVMYAICGWMIMYPGDWMIPGVFSFGLGLGYGESAIDNSPIYEAYTLNADFIFQGMFAATAATIVSGAVAGRIALGPFLLFTALFVGISYPITGSWQWGGGWLDELGFVDFAGSTLVHAVGGTGALVGAIILGPRLGKYASDGTVNPIPGHNLPLATIGVFLLWLGWFGFNGGSVLSADPAEVSLVFVTTGIAAACGCISAGIISWIAGGKPDLTMALNGVLGGLVGITAGADLMSWPEAAIIGIIAGAIVYFSVLALDKIKIDDPVGAISVHLVAGIWGTLAVGIFGSEASFAQLMNQIIGCFSIIIFTAISATILFLVIKAVFGLRVSAEEEMEGLDLGEHDMSAYPDFQRVYIKSYHAREM